MSSITIKYSKEELELLINSLTMTCTTQVPTESHGLWKKPYESLLKDLKRILADLREKELDKQNETNNTPIEETEINPGTCD